MAAYASLVSLLNTMEQIQTHPLLSTCFDKYQNESLRTKVDFFLDFVENYSDAGSREADDLLRRIAFVAHAAEDITECEATDRVRAVSTKKRLQMLLHLQRIIDGMFSIEEKVIKFKEETGCINRQPSYSTSSAASVKTAAMVGFDGYLVQLLDQLTGQPPERRIISIVGMGGIGKTTLARNMYENRLTVQHFDVRAWVTVSQDYNAREILKEALSCLGGLSSNIGEDQLGEELHKTLYGRRYLIILDDVWSVEVWDRMNFYFPENNNGSRIVVTTRLSEVVDYFSSSAVALSFLDDSKSWELFCEKTFPRESCPLELEDIGKKIVNKCKGLPLAIVVIGGLLGKSSRTQEYWEKIGDDISLILNSREGNKVLSILYLSYKHLPACLKSCFLYLGLFPEDYDIRVFELIKLWVAEGFIKPNTHQSLEEIAEGYVKELIDRSLLLVRGFRPHKRFETCSVHDLVRDLSIKIAAKEDFVCVQRDEDGRRHFTVDERTSSFYRQNNSSGFMLQPPSLVHPQIFTAKCYLMTT
ncbi:putative late blight resistance protein homolog R1C-3 [Salvia miltiorrhiza]|uniref:putative late blight resistance protein homolog R1C-3 n=1 Tax=Salvia miltiorrhiza TaxID=226208 RepID=UPI0025AC69C8|nr:putative late blight resistance protein homolog R1C-3 [Salvia miltiorrhiza]